MLFSEWLILLKDDHVRISSKCFRDMILFSGKYANRLINFDNLQHSYGYLLGKHTLQGKIDILQFIPIDGGSLLERTIDKSEFNSDGIEPTLSIYGFFHAFPRNSGRLSEKDIISLSKFGLNAICIIFDFTKVDQYNNGFLIFQREDTYIKNTPYTIIHPEDGDKFYFARSLVDITEKYESTGTISPSEASSTEYFETYPLGSKTDHSVTEEFSNSKLLEENSSSDYEEYELSLIEQDFEIQKLRYDIDEASSKGKSSAYAKLKLASRLRSQMARDSEILRYLEAAEEEFEAGQDSESKLGLATTKNELGLFYEDRGNYYTSLNYFDESYAILAQLGDFARIGRVLNNIGNIYLKLRNFDAALQKYNEAYENATNLADKVLVFSNIADVYLELRNYSRAFTILVKNAEFFQESKNDYGLSIVFSKLGTLYYSQGSQYYHLAKKFSHLALAIKKRNEFHRESIDDYELLSMIYLEEKSFRVAEDTLIQGLNIIRTLGYEQKEASFYDLLGRLYQNEKQINEALEYYALARESYELFGEKESAGNVLEIMGDIHRDHLQNLAQAQGFYEEALTIYKEEKYRKSQADLLVKIAEIHMDLGEQNSAIECLQKAYALYKGMFDDSTANLILERINTLEL